MGRGSTAVKKQQKRVVEEGIRWGRKIHQLTGVGSKEKVRRVSGGSLGGRRKKIANQIKK